MNRAEYTAKYSDLRNRGGVGDNFTPHRRSWELMLHGFRTGIVQSERFTNCEYRIRIDGLAVCIRIPQVFDFHPNRKGETHEPEWFRRYTIMISYQGYLLEEFHRPVGYGLFEIILYVKNQIRSGNVNRDLA